MYTKEEREGILWEFHCSGLSARKACRTLPPFLNPGNLYRWLRMEDAGGLAAREMPDRLSRMHCSHGEGSPRYAERWEHTSPARGSLGREGDGGGGPRWRTPRGTRSRRTGATGAATCCRRTRRGAPAWRRSSSPRR
ncbi:hypothetical protein [Olsenella sp. Marseille-P4559]|uniref:hypothetical protein n=1 Tax=Olsenella sp. Marseille-P4559 TaxID=2364795 RepID=UPI0010319ED0|nr:hypothetical protein [Olsenella sp. Marseille-P4559]